MDNMVIPPGSPIIDPSLIARASKRGDLLWGASKKGKGVNAGFGAQWVLERKGKKFLYLTAEPASMPTQIERMIKAGMGDMLSVLDYPEHIPSILSAVLEGGIWPVYRQLKTGVVADFKSKESLYRYQEFGLLIVDSLISIGEVYLQWLSDPKHSAVLPMTPDSKHFMVEDVNPHLPADMAVKWGGSSGTHVYFVQQRLQELISASANLGYDKTLWISRETRGARGEKKKRNPETKQMEISVEGEPMYGPSLPGSGDVIARVTSWFGGAYHCDAVRTTTGTDDKRPTEGPAVPVIQNQFTQAAAAKEKAKGIIPDWEYRIYIRPHPDPKTGLLYDAGNRLPAHINSNPAIAPPYFVCTSEPREDGLFNNVGLNTIWDLEEQYNATGGEDQMQKTLASILAKFKK